MTTTCNIDPNFIVDILTKEDYNSHNDIAEEAIHLSNNATVFQAEVFAVGRAASHLIFAKTRKNCCHKLRQPGCNYGSYLTTLKLSPKLP